MGYLGSALGMAIGGSVGGMIQLLFLLGPPTAGIGCAVYAFVRNERLLGVAGFGLVLSIEFGFSLNFLLS